ncbi:metabolite traffic protein EboE [Prauserella cavernicola]|uniref:Metabolite traffic protein EboE n=1 Tax=Prauserella cavernicola TaxID=2800127 RepID=A0A934QQD4_9PSEU|nr:metabolite traffic protein EboE [Prauserella cavernicola]MBK1786277.1 metabolite traffic protein EboE [Prauserella cavernicola]
MLSYCTNVHPAEDLAGILAQLDTYAVPVREKLGQDRLGVGLWLASEVAAGLASDPAARRTLAAELKARGLAVQTLNAFPYGGFHAEVVKHQVYVPTWTDPKRLRYTLDCITVLGDLLPEDAAYGSISTLPLAWREPWSTSHDVRASIAFEEVTRVLRSALARNEQPIRLAIEPEPGCVLDTVADAVDWLAGRVDPEYIGLCLDTCHLAVSFADPARTVERIRASGLKVVKVQASAALHVERPGTDEAVAALREFAEPRYLHQVREQLPTGEVLAADDLPEALETLPAQGPWRVHFHVPLHATPASPLESTTGVLTGALDALAAQGPLPHVEVETYTWNVLPGHDRQELAAGIADELRWASLEVPA